MYVSHCRANIMFVKIHGIHHSESDYRPFDKFERGFEITYFLTDRYFCVDTASPEPDYRSFRTLLRFSKI